MADVSPQRTWKRAKTSGERGVEKEWELRISKHILKNKQ